MLWPQSSSRTTDGQLSIGGVPLPQLAADFGTPLYIYDEITVRERARRFRAAFTSNYPNSSIVYAAKALPSPAMIALLHEEGLGLDVVSGGELYAGLAAGMPPAFITFHGNNKGEAELREALAAEIGFFAIDNLDEVRLLSRLVGEAGAQVQVLLRLNPGVDVHTHRKIATGVADSKFGVPVWTGHAALAVEEILHAPGLNLVGYHAHIGSQIFDCAAYKQTIFIMLEFAAEMRDRFGFAPEILSPGGGFGIAYEPNQEEAVIEEWAEVASATLRTECARHDLPLPRLIVEPGRAIVGPAGVALYRVGTIKDVAGIRTYVAVDGGMADNIRPTLYGAKYSVAIANRTGAGPDVPVTIAGKFCESGDLLVEDASLPMVEPGDLLCLPAAGAYCLAMASNYNLSLRPAVVLVRDGQVRPIRRRETYEDLLSAEIYPGKTSIPSGAEVVTEALSVSKPLA